LSKYVLACSCTLGTYCPTSPWHCRCLCRHLSLDCRLRSRRKQRKSLKSCLLVAIMTGDEISRTKSQESSSLSGRGWSHRKAGRAAIERHQTPASLLRGRPRMQAHR
jgi:hypothetical protein